MNNKKLLEARERAKKRKPTFGRKDSNKKKRIESDVWRKARGCDNKQRLKRKGHKKTPKQGFRSPIAVRGFDASGLMPILVTNLNQLMNIAQGEGVIVSSNLGDRKRRIVLEAANKKGLTVLNLDASKAIEQIDAKLKQRAQEKKTQEEQKKKQVEKKEPKKEAPAPAEKKEPDSETNEDEKKKQEKEEKDKVLTMKK
jgi:large subunit ribosomal protein L32e